MPLLCNISSYSLRHVIIRCRRPQYTLFPRALCQIGRKKPAPRAETKAHSGGSLSDIPFSLREESRSAHTTLKFSLPPGYRRTVMAFRPARCPFRIRSRTLGATSKKICLSVPLHRADSSLEVLCEIITQSSPAPWKPASFCSLRLSGRRRTTRNCLVLKA